MRFHLARAGASGQALYCLDISETFLDYARRECTDIGNISFQRGSFVDLGGFPDESMDAVVASAVFIHADLFAISLFFAEIKRVLRVRGRVAFDFLDANRLMADDRLFAQHTAEYRAEPANYPELCKWNSAPALVRIAQHHGFSASVFALGPEPNSILSAVKQDSGDQRLRRATLVRLRHFLRSKTAAYIAPPIVPA